MGSEGKEGGGDIDVLFSADLHEKPAIFLSIIRAHLIGYYFVGQVYLVANQDDHYTLCCIVFYLLVPRL